MAKWPGNCARLGPEEEEEGRKKEDKEEVEEEEEEEREEKKEGRENSKQNVKASQIYLAVLNEYTNWSHTPQDDERAIRDQTLQILSDAQITAPVLHMADLHSNINQKSFFYVFNHQSVYGDYPVSQGTVHGEELAYVFGAPLVGGFNHFGLNYTLDEVFLSELVMTQWTNFARTGNPNLPTPQRYKNPGADLNWEENMKTLWPPYEKQLQQYLHIDMQVVTKNHYRAHPLALWNHLIPNLIRSTRIPTDPSNRPPYTGPTDIVLVPTRSPRLMTSTQQPTPDPDKDKKSKFPTEYYPGTYPDYPDLPPTVLPMYPAPPPPPPPPPAAAGTPISIVILVGIAILFINCCAMGGVYYQRDKIRHQSRLLRKTLRPRKAEDSDEKVSDVTASNTAKDKSHKKKGSRSDYEVSDEIHSDTVSHASAVSRESSMKRKHSQAAHDTSSKQVTPKGSLKGAKSPKSGHRRHKSENSIYSEIAKTAEVVIHADARGPSRSSSRKNPTVTFNTLGTRMPPKALTKSTTSITSKASIKSNTSHASVKSTTSHSSIKSTSSEKRLKKNASCQSLPTAEYTWGITREMTMTERDDPEGRDDQHGPADRQQALVATQKLNYPKVRPDRPEGIHAATLPKMRPPPPPRSTSLTARDIQELENRIHVVYRKKRNPRRDVSTDSCDLSAIDNIYLMGTDAPPPGSMYGAPAATATVSRSRPRKSDGTPDYGHTSASVDYVRSGPSGEYGRPTIGMDYGKPVAVADYGRPGGGHMYGGYPTYEQTYTYKDNNILSSQKPTSPQPGEQKTFGPYGVPRVQMATFGKTNSHSPGDGATEPEKTQARPTYDGSTSYTSTPSAAAAVTAAAHTALAAATAPAFVGASSTTRSAPRGTVCPAPPPAATRTMALRQQSSTTSGSDTGTVYEQSENTGTIKRRKSIKKDNVTQPVVTPEPEKTYDKPLKGVLKQTSAYDKPKPLMAKAPGASPSPSASSLSSSGTSIEVCSVVCEPAAQDPLHKTPSMRKGLRVATPGIRRKNKNDNQTTTTLMQTDSPK
ncbi:uncharacterized protein [Procambarus clarkii]|uniref:uncharacterized protein n=1 Tax=Procambarus clarkii TaxID=6728 RepID=UPI0037445E60